MRFGKTGSEPHHLLRKAAAGLGVFAMAIGSVLVISPSAFASPTITVNAPGIQSFSSWPGSWFVLNQPDEYTVTPYPVPTTATSTPQSTNTGYWTQKQVDTQIAHTSQSWVNTSHYVSYQYYVTSGYEATGQHWVTSGYWATTRYYVNTSHYVSYRYWVNTSHYVSYQYWVNSGYWYSNPHLRICTGGGYEHYSGYWKYYPHDPHPVFIVTGPNWWVSTETCHQAPARWINTSHWATGRRWITSGYYATGRRWITSGYYATGRRWINTSHNVPYQYYVNTSHYATGQSWVTSGYYQTTTTYTTLVTYETVWVPTVTTVTDTNLTVTSSKLRGVLPGIRDVTPGSPFDGQEYWAGDSSTDGGFCPGAETPLIAPDPPAFPNYSNDLPRYTQFFESMHICTFNPDFIQNSNVQAWQINQDRAAMLLIPSWTVTLTYTQVTSVSGSVTSSVPKTTTETVNGPVFVGPPWTIYWYQGVSCTMVNGHLQCPLGTAENPYPTNGG